MIFGSTLLSLAVVTASVGEVTEVTEVRRIEPQTRAIAGESEVLEVDLSTKTYTRPNLAPTGKTAEPTVPSPRRRITDGPIAANLGCGQLVSACARLTTVGVISGGAGIAVIASSTALLLTPNQVIADRPAYVRNYDRVGTTLLALGIGLATTGVLMVFTAARASRSRRKLRASSRQIAAVGRR